MTFTLEESAPLSEHFAEMKSGIDMETFNQLLRSEGIDPADVALLRHQTVRNGKTPFSLWTSDKSAFLRYQSTQHDLPIFRKKYWASFVSPSRHETLFVGLYRTQRRPEIKIDWLDPLSGLAVGYGRHDPYYFFECEFQSELSNHVGSLFVDWGASLRQWAQYAIRQDKRIVSRTSRYSSGQSARAGSATQKLARGLESFGFATSHRTKKVTTFRDGLGLTVYLKNETERFPLILHPYYDAFRSELNMITGVSSDPSRLFYINSNLINFPVYSEAHRMTSSRYGVAVDAADGRSLGLLIEFLRQHRSIPTPDGRVEIGNDYTPEKTEREALRLARIGQGQFRANCLQMWAGCCALSGVSISEVLRASHIKPWHASTNFERLDPYNGLLLAAHIDALFDRHLISFANDGSLVVSQRLPGGELEKLGIRVGAARISKLDDRHKPYLAIHRAALI